MVFLPSGDWRAGYAHCPVVTGGGSGSVKNPQFLWVNTMLGNIKNVLHGTYHAVLEKHLPRYWQSSDTGLTAGSVWEICSPGSCMWPLRTPPLRYRLAKLAENHG